MALSDKIRKAIIYTVNDGCIVDNGNPEAWETKFLIGGEDQFYNHLLSICTAAEKTELLLEWVLKNGDEETAVTVCEFMMGSHNGLHSIAKEAANRIIKHYQADVDEALE